MQSFGRERSPRRPSKPEHKNEHMIRVLPGSAAAQELTAVAADAPVSLARSTVRKSQRAWQRAIALHVWLLPGSRRSRSPGSRAVHAIYPPTRLPSLARSGPACTSACVEFAVSPLRPPPRGAALLCFPVVERPPKRSVPRKRRGPAAQAAREPLRRPSPAPPATGKPQLEHECQAASPATGLHYHMHIR